MFEQEPPEQDDPAWELENLLITPHTAGNMTLAYTVEKITEQFLEDLENYSAGKEMKHRVDRSKGY